MASRLTLDALPECVEAVARRVLIHVDGGFRKESSIFKALCARDGVLLDWLAWRRPEPLARWRVATGASELKAMLQSSYSVNPQDVRR